MEALKLEQVVKQYGDKTAVNKISLKVEQGEIYGLLGANGSKQNNNNAHGAWPDLSRRGQDSLQRQVL